MRRREGDPKSTLQVMCVCVFTSNVRLFIEKVRVTGKKNADDVKLLRALDPPPRFPRGKPHF